MKENGYMTVYLALTLGVLISLCLALTEGCRYGGIRLETECVMDIGMDSLLAEYHRELFRQYNLFAIDCSYGTAAGTTKATEQRLLEYMNHNFSLKDIFLDKILYRDFFALKAEEAEMTKAVFLTDAGGEVFRRMAVNALEDDIGVGIVQQVTEWLQTIESEGLQERNIAEEKQAVDAQIEEYEGKHIESPTKVLEEKRSGGLLSLVLPEEDISDRRMEEGTLIAARIKENAVNHGNIDISQPEGWEETTQRILFHEYLLRYMGRYSAEKEGNPLWYEVEYIIGGALSDRENLRFVVNRLFAVREAANAVYLFGSEENYAIAKALGEAIAAALMVPEIGELFTVSLVLGWAFAESVYDVKTLLSGGRIPLLKNDDSWHYGLQGILQGDLAEVSDSEEASKTEGMSYEDYLRVFLFLTDSREVTFRAMNVVEQNIRNTVGNSAFRLDACLTEIEMNVKVQSRYGYEVEIRRRKSYTESLEAEASAAKK